MRTAPPIIAAVASIILISPAASQVASLSTSDETIMAGPTTVRIQKAQLPGDGLAIVRAVREGRVAAAPLGQSRIKAGETSDVRIQLARPARPGESLVVMLHADLGRKGVLDRDPVVLSVDIPERVVSAAAKRP